MVDVLQQKSPNNVQLNEEHSQFNNDNKTNNNNSSSSSNSPSVLMDQIQEQLVCVIIVLSLRKRTDYYRMCCRRIIFLSRKVSLANLLRIFIKSSRIRIFSVIEYVFYVKKASWHIYQTIFSTIDSYLTLAGLRKHTEAFLNLIFR